MLMTCDKIVFNREAINYFLWCRWGEAQLNSLYGAGNSHRKPLKLEVIEQINLQVSTLPEYYHYNPSLKIENGIIRIFWRVSAFSIRDYQDDLGRWQGRGIEDLNHFERIATGVLGHVEDSDFGLIHQQTVLPEIEITNREGSARAIGYEDAQVYVEDPRAHAGSGRYITACARFAKFGEDFFRMIVIDLATNKGSIITSSDLARTEKNWVVIHEFEDSLLFLNQSKPMVVEEVEIKSGFSKRREIQEDNTLDNSTNLNGGSPFVRIDSKHYIRVARLQFPVFPLGVCRISVLVLHDLDFKEVARSKPFVFNKLGIDICHGLMVKEDLVYFSWGEDDRTMFIGWCKTEELMRWFSENLQG